MTKTKLFLSLLVIVMAVALVGGATLAWFTDSASAEDVSFQAGTLLIDAGSSLIYGVEQGTGYLYEIDVVSGDEILLFDGTTNDGDQNYPNALAYDRNNQRLYYANVNGSLKFHEIGTNIEVTSGNLASSPVAGATFGRGYYWYIPQNSSTLYRANFNSAGLLIENEPYIQTITDPDGNNITFAGFGDIAMEIQGSRLYGSARVNGGYRYFVINLTTKMTELYVVEDVSNMLQLAFGADGQLYGHATVSKQWFSIDTDTGNRGDIVLTGENSYTDLASNWQNNWNPGDCDMARFYVRNTGTKNSYIRVDWRAEWTDLGFDEDDVVVEITPCDDSWLPNDPDDGYLYYQTPLAPGEEAILCLKVCLKDKETGNPYQGKTFELQPNFEAIQITNDASVDEWGWTNGASE